jgi:hypothetical protein
MNFKICTIAAMLVMGAASASAQRLTTYTDTFLYDTSDRLLALGFGRGGDVISPSTGSSARFVQESFSTLSAATPGALPFTFHDVWKFDGLAAGTYSLDTTINAFTHTTFGLVLFVWSDKGSPESLDFQVASDMKSAQGSGTFTVDPGCIHVPGEPPKYCASLHIFGWDDGLDIPGSGYGGPTTTFGVTVVPEPTTGAMLLAGLGALGWLARRRRA